MAKDGHKTAQDLLKLLQDGPKIPQDGLKFAQDGLKMAASLHNAARHAPKNRQRHQTPATRYQKTSHQTPEGAAGCESM